MPLFFMPASYATLIRHADAVDVVCYGMMRVR